jgi:hypothetical protein
MIRTTTLVRTGLWCLSIALKRAYTPENPYNAKEILTLLERLDHPPEWLPKTQRHNCFSRLPWEILEAIAIKLPTDDALGLRHASKAFLPSGIFLGVRI